MIYLREIKKVNDANFIGHIKILIGQNDPERLEELLKLYGCSDNIDIGEFLDQFEDDERSFICDVVTRDLTKDLKDDIMEIPKHIQGGRL